MQPIVAARVVNAMNECQKVADHQHAKERALPPNDQLPGTYL